MFAVAGGGLALLGVVMLILRTPVGVGIDDSAVAEVLAEGLPDGMSNYLSDQVPDDGERY